MPTYTAKCPACNNETDYFRKIADRFDTPICDCGTKTEKMITACMVPCMAIAESMNVVSPIDGTVLRSKSDYDAHCKKHKVLPASEFEGTKAPEKKSNKEEIAKAVSMAYDKIIGG